MQEKDTFILPNVQGIFYVKMHGSKNSLPFPIFIFFYLHLYKRRIHNK